VNALDTLLTFLIKIKVIFSYNINCIKNSDYGGKMTAITVKISKEEKDLYHKICKREDTTMSQAIRAYIREQIKSKKVYLDEQKRG
jgi:hypothetical protein